MATLTVSTLTRSGVIDLVATAVAADAALTDKFLNYGKEFLYVHNAGGSPCVVTLNFGPGATVDAVAPTNKTVTIAAGKDGMIGPFPTNFYNDANGYMNVHYDQVASVKVLPVSLPV